MLISAVVTIADNNGVTDEEFTVAGQVTFDVTIINPCTTATITALSFSPAAPTVVFGNTVYTEWNTPTTSVDVTHSSDGGFCGPITYEIFHDEADAVLTSAYNADWAVISQESGDTYRLTFDTNEDQALLGSLETENFTMYIKSTLTDWSVSEYDSITVTVTEATCDCSFLEWTAPDVLETIVAVDTPDTPAVPVPTEDTSLTATNPAFAKCYLDAGCDTAG